VVGDRAGRAKHGHDGVAGELVQHAAVDADHRGHRPKVPTDDLGHLPRRDLLGEGGEPPDIGEQDGDLQLPLQRQRRR
jgi:hypothetical protein